MRVSLEIAETQEQLDEVLPLRQHINVPGKGTDSFAVQERARDKNSIVMMYRKGPELAGTMRLVPLGSGEGPSEWVFEMLGLPLKDHVEGGRLVLAEKYRGRGLLFDCFVLCYLHMRKTRFVGGYTVCTPKLTHIYQRYGCTMVAKNIVNDHNGVPLSVLHFTFSYKMFFRAAWRALKSLTGQTC